MSDEGTSKPAGPPTTITRTARRHLRVYFETWLLCAFVTFAFGIAFAVADAKNQGRAPEKLWMAIVVAPILALLSLPALWLLRIFRESAPNAWLRTVRRVLLGMVCGLVPAALLVLLLSKKHATELGNLEIFWLCGLVYGAAGGLIDAMHLDARYEEELGP